MAKKTAKIKKSIEDILANENIVQRDVIDEMEEASLNYAIKTIIDRALPDVRDGLKPVQRRILYAMHDLGMASNKGYRKSANVNGHVMAKFHPHGDSYGAMVNMANDLGIRYPVVDGQGNFGHPLDGDGPAAARYTEAKLDKRGEAILADVDKKVVDFQPNYSEEVEEPVVLPAGIPFLLANGATGIATGYTTEIPSHNLGEIGDGLLALIKNNEITSLELLNYIAGPDLPTGGYLIKTDDIIKLYETGQGSLKFRAKMVTEFNNETGNNQLVITELTPDIKKAGDNGIVKKLYDLCLDDKLRKIPGVVDIRDESTGKKDKKTGKNESSVRIVVELYKTAIPEVVMSDLYKYTSLEKTKGYILRAVVNQAPAILSLKDMLSHYLNHRRDVVYRRTEFDLDKAKAKLHIQEGFKIAFLNLDQVIDIVRNSDDAKTELMTAFKLTEIQTEKILELPLRRISKLEETKIDAEIAQLKTYIAELSEILADSTKIDDIIVDEINDFKTKFGDKRKTTVIEALEEVTASIADEPMMAILTNKGVIKQIPEEAFNDMVTNRALRENKEVYIQAVKCRVSDEFVLILENGKYVKADFGDLINVNKVTEGGKIAGFFVYDEKEANKNIVVMTRKGMVKKSKMKAFRARSKRIADYIELQGNDDKIIGVKVTDGDDFNTIVISTEKGTIHRFYERSFSATNAGGNGIGCINESVIKEENDNIADFAVYKEGNDDNSKIILYVTTNPLNPKDVLGSCSMKSMSLAEFRTKGRVSKGIIGVPKNFDDKVYRIKVTDSDYKVIDEKGILHNQKFVSIPVQSRYNKPNDLTIKPFIINFFIE